MLVNGFGVLADLLLLGILTNQIYFYYLAYPEDKLAIKLAVTTVYALGLSQTIIALFDHSRASLYTDYDELCRAFISDIWDPSLASKFDGAFFWFSIFLSSAIVAFVAQCLYVYRIFIMSQKLWLSIMVNLLSLSQLIIGIISSICAYDNSENIMLDVCNKVQGQYNSYLWCPLTVTCDVTISIIMSTLLLKRRKDVFKKNTHAQITKIVQLIAETGAATSLVVLTYAASAIFQFSNKYNTAPIPGLATGKVYSNSMLVILNSRAKILGARETSKIDWNTVEMSPGFTDVGDGERNLSASASLNSVQLRARAQRLSIEGAS
ncbi:hypothetical protein NP233_g3605 [Leucocoprinus birnbaumii]|uniref:DUF6534 domain-containing protein n=1 Tax=Leucocoprinus birnbaumii TaxID=56174 RepID=A0AAD5VYU8_9AGAR|nr:hypothetical protein NP233_g3605 [Leucocoprinus birnbaumii]